MSLKLSAGLSGAIALCIDKRRIYVRVVTGQGVMADMPDFNAKLWSQNLSAVLDRNRDMAACRKLKQDIEQTLKKVADGILLFNEFNKKMEESQVCMPECS